MRIIVGDRARGKTFLVVEWFGENPRERAVVVPDEYQRDRFIRDVYVRFPEMQSRARAWVGHVVRWEEAPRAFLGGIVKEIFIDNLDMILSSMFRGAQLHVTMTYPPEVVQL